MYGSGYIDRFLKLQFANSLVFSRLFYHAQLVVPTVSYMRALNNVYMRVMRRIADKMRFSADAMSDLNVRTSLRVPSVDCRLLKMRLLYLLRVLQSHPLTLLALLAVKVNRKHLPWTSLIVADLIFVREHVEDCKTLPSASDYPAVWKSFILDDPDRWRNIVSSIFFVESRCDKSHSSSDKVIANHICAMCSDPFSSSKALSQHARIKHGARNPMRFYIKDGVCPACKCDFVTRSRCIAHVSDSRRDKCRKVLLGGHFKMLSASIVQKLDDQDKVLVNKAKRSGHTHPIAVGQAKNAKGKAIGRARF